MITDEEIDVFTSARCSTHVSRAAYATDLRQFAAWCSAERVDGRDPSRLDLERFRAALEAGYAPRTVARRLSAVSSWLRWLVELGELDVNRADAVRRPRIGKTEGATAALTIREVRALLAAADDPSERLLVSLLATTGMRVSEACGLDLDDLRTVSGVCVAMIQPKGGGGDARPVPLPDSVCALVDEIRQERNSGPLLVGRWTPGMSRQTAARALDRLGHAAGIGHVHPHQLRATAITESLRAGVPLDETAALVGHSSVEITLGYDRRRRRLEDSPVHVLDDLLDGGGVDAA